MPRMSKEEERVEKIIRGLSKLPENKKCINCNSLGPQYVCTTFWTFICMNCSGIHREFTHRVKSVSMSTFSMEEANALKAGGNERAREIYFKTLDVHRNTVSDSSSLHKLRDFIRNVYVDRKYTDDQDQLAMFRKDDVDDDKDKHSGPEKSNKVALQHHLLHSSSEGSIRYSRNEIVPHDSNERLRSARDAFLELFANGPFSERPREGTRDNSSHHSSERPHRGARDDFLGRPSFGRKRGNARSDRHSFDTPSRGVRDDFLERHSFENSSQGAKYEFPERSSSKSSVKTSPNSRNYIEEGRSPSYKQEEPKSGSQRGRKPRFEIVDDRFREDNNTGSAKHYDSIRYSNTRHNVGNASPDSPRRRDTRKTLAICSAKEALDRKFPPLKAGESTGSVSDKLFQVSQAVQKEEDHLNRDSATGKENESNNATPTSLLDFNPTPETTSTTDIDEGDKTSSVDGEKKTSSVDEGEKKTSSIDNDDAPTSRIKEAPDAQNVSPLESLLLDWTTPSNTTAEDSTSTVSNIAGSIPSDLNRDNQHQTDLAIQTTEASPDSKDDMSSEVEQGAASVVAESNQTFSSGPATNDEGSLANDLPRLSPQVNSQQPLETRGTNESSNSIQTLETRGSIGSHNSIQALETSGSNEPQPSQRKELPVDLFAGSYAPFPVRGPVPVAVPGWQLHPPHGMAYGMQYPPAPMCMPPFTNSAPSRNPFDIGGDVTHTAAPPFSHIPAVQGQQPNMMVPNGLQNQESSHAFSWQSHQYPYGMATVPGAFHGQEVVPYDAMDSSQQLSTRYSAPTTSNSSSTTGGNPFGQS